MNPGHRNTGRSAVIRHDVRGRFPVCLSHPIEKQHNFPRPSSSLERDARFEDGSLRRPLLDVHTILDSDGVLKPVRSHDFAVGNRLLHPFLHPRPFDLWFLDDPACVPSPLSHSEQAVGMLVDVA